MERNKKGIIEYPEEYWKDVSHSARELVELMTHPDPSKRITAELCLKHPWLKPMTLILPTAQENLEEFPSNNLSGELFNKTGVDFKDNELNTDKGMITENPLKERLTIPIPNEDKEFDERRVRAFLPGANERRLLPETPGARCRTKQSMEVSSLAWTQPEVHKRSSDSCLNTKKYVQPLTFRLKASKKANYEVSSYGGGRKPLSSKGLVFNLIELKEHLSNTQSI